MPFCPIVDPESVRIYLAESIQKRIDTLTAEIADLTKKIDTARESTPGALTELKELRLTCEAKQAELQRAENGAAFHDHYKNWIEVKRELNTFEYRQMLSAQFKESYAGERAKIDLHQLGWSKVLAYLVGWSFTDKHGDPLPVNEQTLRLFKADLFSDLLAAIDAHDEAVTAAQEAEKNALGSATRLRAI